MFLFIVYTAIFIVLIHTILYYFNIDYLNIMQKNKEDSRMVNSTKSPLLLDDDVKKDIDNTIDILESSLNQLKQNTTPLLDNKHE